MKKNRSNKVKHKTPMQKTIQQLIAKMETQKREEYLRHMKEAEAQMEAARKRTLTERDFESFLYLHDEMERFDAFLSIQNQLSDAEYWQLLSSVWQDSEVTLPRRNEWLELFRSQRPGKSNVMNDYEKTRYAALPDTVRVYRGLLRKSDHKGLSWTLDLRVADWFAFYACGSRRALFCGKASGKPRVAAADIPKEKIFAVICGRGEEEVVLDSEFVTNLVVQPADYQNAYDSTGRRTFNHPTGYEEDECVLEAIAA